MQRETSTATSLRPKPLAWALTRLSARTGQAATQAPQPVQQGRQRTGAELPAVVGGEVPWGSGRLCMGVLGQLQEDAVGAMAIDQTLAGVMPGLHRAEELDAMLHQPLHRSIDVGNGKG